jgi:hypothetical protein
MGVVHLHFEEEGVSGYPCTRGIVPLRQQKIAKIRGNIVISLMQW